MLHNGGVLGNGGSMERRAKPGRAGKRKSVDLHVLDGRTRHASQKLLTVAPPTGETMS